MTLGIVLTPYGKVPGAYPYEINRSAGSMNSFLCPADPQYMQNGEYGYYYDTPLGYQPPVKSVRQQIKKWFKRTFRSPGFNGFNGNLGAIPTDYEIAKHVYSWYTPVQSSWIWAKEGYIPPPWAPPPADVYGAGQFAPPISLNGALRGTAQATLLGTSLGEITAEDAQQAILRELNEHHKRQFALTALTTAVGVAAAVVSIYRTVTLVKHDKQQETK